MPPIRYITYGPDGDSRRLIANTVCKAWMLWRCQRGGWHERKPSRARWWLAELEQLRRDIVELDQHGRTGHHLADAEIEKFCPQAFA